MQILQFSPGALAPGGRIAVPPIHHTQLLLCVNGRADADCRDPAGQLVLSAGTGLLLTAGEHCRLATDTGAIVLIVTAERLLADRCGPSLPERVRGQLWPHLQSN